MYNSMHSCFKMTIWYYKIHEFHYDVKFNISKSVLSFLLVQIISAQIFPFLDTF
jgi:hypothetical protein